MNETILYIYIYIYIYNHFILKRSTQFVVSWDIDGETYTQIRDFLLSIIFFREPGVANACPFSLLAVSSEKPLIGCLFLARQRFSAVCSNLTAWFSWSGLLPVTHLFYPVVLIVLPCLLITTWQLVKAYRVIRNELKIHGICYNGIHIFLVLQ